MRSVTFSTQSLERCTKLDDVRRTREVRAEVLDRFPALGDADDQAGRQFLVASPRPIGGRRVLEAPRFVGQHLGNEDAIRRRVPVPSFRV